MTVLDDRQIDRQLAQWAQVWPREVPRVSEPARRTDRPVTRMRPGSARAGRPGPAGPAIAPLRYAGTGVAMSRAAHLSRRTVSTTVTVALAALAALITVWLGSIAQFSSDRSAAAAVSVPEQLAVVQVQAGETLQQLAARVAPDAPSVQTVERIRDLNKLASAAIDAGQTLIAPVG